MVKAKTGEWWKNGIIYQIYPRSFHDTDGDGIGDIPGITRKLDYLSGLGVNAIWLSPVHLSPSYDFGYDIADYRQIDSIFGTMEDFDELVREAHHRNLRVIMDLVVNHTSHLHPWFAESRQSRDNPKSDWYIWHEGKRRFPPNNWKSAFGGSAWKWDRERKQFYLHSFLKEQPDLNWRNPEVKKAVFEDMKFWLDRGVDGFRLDVVNCFVKDIDYRSNPFHFGPTIRPYDMQKHLYDRDRPEMHDILKDLRLVMDEYPDTMTVGEVLTEQPGDPKTAAGYLGKGDDELHLTFDFSMLHGKWDAERFFHCVRDWYAALPKKGWPALVMNNHDESRSMTRYKKGKQGMARAKVMAAFLLTLKGTPFIYYGEEIGMTDLKIRRREVRDPVGKKYWPLHKGRDPFRTPMQWSAEANAGFSSNEPWVRVPKDYPANNVQVQTTKADSLLNHYKQLIALRKEKRNLAEGDWAPLMDGSEGVIAYYRSGVKNEDRLLVFLNFTNKKVKIHTQEQGNWKIVYSSQKPLQEEYISLNFNLMPYEVTIFEEVILVK